MHLVTIATGVDATDQKSYQVEVSVLKYVKALCSISYSQHKFKTLLLFRLRNTYVTCISPFPIQPQIFNVIPPEFRRFRIPFILFSLYKINHSLILTFIPRSAFRCGIPPEFRNSAFRSFLIFYYVIISFIHEYISSFRVPHSAAEFRRNSSIPHSAYF